MLIGKDFDKLQWHFNGYDLLEPNSFISDSILGIAAWYLFIIIKKESKFNIAWKYFFFWFGASFFVGGFAHLFFNYWGVPGKIPPFFMMLIATFYAEIAMISIHKNNALLKRFENLSVIKLIGMICLLLLFLVQFDISKNVQLGILLPSINSVIGFTFILLYLPKIYEKQFGISFNAFRIAFMFTLISALFQAFKINIHPWFDRNDASHYLLLISLYFYMKGIKKVQTNIVPSN